MFEGMLRYLFDFFVFLVMSLIIGYNLVIIVTGMLIFFCQLPGKNKTISLARLKLFSRAMPTFWSARPVRDWRKERLAEYFRKVYFYC